MVGCDVLLACLLTFGRLMLCIRESRLQRRVVHTKMDLVARTRRSKLRAVLVGMRQVLVHAMITRRASLREEELEAVSLGHELIALGIRNRHKV